MIARSLCLVLLAISGLLLLGGQTAGAQEAAMHRANARQTGVYDVTGPTSRPRVAWRHRLPGPTTDLVVGSDRVLCALQSPTEDAAGVSRGKLYALDAATGDVSWALSELEAPATIPAILNGRVYVGTGAGAVYSIDAATGQIEGRLSLDAGISGPCTAAGDTLYFGTDRGYVLSVDADLRNPRQTHVTDRDIRWMRQQEEAKNVPEPWPGHIWTGPAVDGDTLYISSSEEQVRAIHLQSGRVLWQQPIDGIPPVWPRLIQGIPDVAVLADARVTVTDTHVLYVPHPSALRCADRQTGQKQWDRSLWQPFITDFVVENGMIYLASPKGGIWAVDESDGSIAWQGDILPALNLSADEKHIYFGTNKGQVYALDKATGQEKWHVDLDVEGGFLAAPVPVDGALFVTSRDGKVFRLE